MKLNPLPFEYQYIILFSSTIGFVLAQQVWTPSVLLSSSYMIITNGIIAIKLFSWSSRCARE
jgi:hypothetical protein